MNSQPSDMDVDNYTEKICNNSRKMDENYPPKAFHIVRVKTDIESLDGIEYIYEMVWWCQKNCIDRWKWWCDIFDSCVIYEFEDDGEAALFKLFFH